MKTKINPLNKKVILKNISKKNFLRLSGIKVLKTTQSTNDEAKRILQEITKDNLSYFFIAEEQTSGRGTKGKKWISPYGKNIYLSLAWKSTLTLDKTDGLSLAVAVAVAEILNKELNLDIKIKWPNDLILQNKKVGGMLIETSLERNSTGIIIGLGLNVFMKKNDIDKIDQEWTSIMYHSNKIPDRNIISGLVMNSILKLTNDFNNYGFTHYRNRFEKLNFLKGKKCKVTSEEKPDFIGKIFGVNDRGELLIKRKEEIFELRSSLNSIVILD